MKTHAFVLSVSLLCFQHLHGSALKMSGQVEAAGSFLGQPKQIKFEAIIYENNYSIQMDDRSFGPRLEFTTVFMTAGLLH
jgi:hypothetical protein